MQICALATCMILCAGRQAFSQQPVVEMSDPFLNRGFLEQVEGPLDGLYADRSTGTGEIEPLFPDPAFPELIPPEEFESVEDAFSYQYPLDQGDYQPPVSPENAQRSWVPPVLRRDEPADSGDGRWLRLKSTKVALSHLGSAGTFGVTTFQLRPTIEFPGAPGIFVTPNFGWHFLQGPTTTDLPPRVHDASVDFSVYRPIGEQWLVQVAFMPGIFTDGDNTSSDALRLQWRLMGFYTMNSGKQLVLGIVYLDREDVPVLPSFGLIVQPRDDLRYELLFPKPRLAWRQYVDGAWEQWVYVTGELGGGSWAVQRSSGLDDIATYRDLRLVLGVERKDASSRTLYLEGGYVFGRELEYQSNLGDTSFADTAFLRIGGAF